MATSTSPAALAAAGNTAYVLLKTRAYDGRAVPCLVDASGSGVQLWLQALHQFMKSCKPVEGKQIHTVFFAETPETEAAAKAAALSVLTLALSDQYYQDCVDDSAATDGETASSIVKVGGIEVHDIDHQVLFKRATKLGDLAILGKSVDDLEVEPMEHFSLDNPGYARVLGVATITRRACPDGPRPAPACSPPAPAPAAPRPRRACPAPCT